MKIDIREATAADAAVILELIRGLADYEKLSGHVTATEEKLRDTLFGERGGADVLLSYVEADWNTPSIGFYKSLGAVPMDEWTKYRVTGEALMKLSGL